jgi:hypothetical protein
MWASYGTRGAVGLAVVLIVVTGAVSYVGARLRNPINIGGTGRTAGVLMVIIWALAICTFQVTFNVYVAQTKQVHLISALPRGLGVLRYAAFHVGTLPDAAVTFFIILYLTRGYGWKVALGSAFVGTAAAPMFFELPFDLIVMSRTFPIPPNPALYRALFFLPLFMLELSTISLLTLLPSVRITRHVLFALGGMFAVFGVWAVFGFGPPTAPLPWTLNIISKMLCFLTAIMLFVRPRSAAARDGMA